MLKANEKQCVFRLLPKAASLVFLVDGQLKSSELLVLRRKTHDRRIKYGVRRRDSSRSQLIAVRFRFMTSARRRRSNKKGSVWCVKLRFFSTGPEVSGSDALPPKICVHPPRWSASTTMRWWRNTRCYQQRWCWLKIVDHIYGLTVQLTSTTLAVVEVCWLHAQLTSAYVWMCRGASHARCAIVEPILQRCVYKIILVAE